MSLIRVQSASKYYGAEQIFANVSVSIDPWARIGVVGQNGEGKTTLLRLIAGHELPDDGRIDGQDSSSVAMLDQDPVFSPHARVTDVAAEPFSDLRLMESRLREMEERISAEPDRKRRDNLIARYGSLMTQFEDRGGYDADARVREALLGLGFSEGDLRRSVDGLSGGEQVRLALARLLLYEPDVMLLDEPTNHLDFSASEWLEEHLTASPSAVVAVSHDRYFLDRLMSEIWEVHGGRVECYRGNFSSYCRKREEHHRRWRRLYERQQDEVEKLKGFIRRYHAGQRSKEAESRRKRLERMEHIEPPPTDEGGLRLTFPISRQSGQDVLRVQDLTLQRGDRVLCCDVNLRVYRGDRIALMGPNGSGKTTVLRALLELDEPVTGDISWGVGAHTAYFPQDLAGPEDGRTVLEEMYASDPDLGMSGAREYLARFGFSGEDVFTRVGDLSGGERSRLLLAEIARKGASVLILDEPTNHLDLQSLQDLESSLCGYEGTVIFVSHDRFFVDRVATKLWVMDEGELVEYPGNYSEYRRMVRSRRAGPESRAEEPKKKEGRASRAPGRRKTKARRGRPPSWGDLTAVEESIEELEEEHERLSEQLADPESYSRGAGGELAREFDDVQSSLQRLYRRWEELATVLEERDQSS